MDGYIASWWAFTCVNTVLVTSLSSLAHAVLYTESRVGRNVGPGNASWRLACCMAHAMQFCMECLAFCCAVNLLHFCIENVIKYSSRLHCDLHFALNAFRTVSQRVSNSDGFLDDEAMKNPSGMPKLPVWNSVRNLSALESVFTSLADAFVPFVAVNLWALSQHSVQSHNWTADGLTCMV